MKNVLKRNQIMITALAIMIAVAGYLNFAGRQASKEDIVTVGSADAAQDIVSLDSDFDMSSTDSVLLDAEFSDLADVSDLTDEIAGEIPGEAVFTSAAGVSELSGARIKKEQTRTQNKEALFEIINNENIAESQKQEAIDDMVHMTEVAEKETAAEILLDAKGFDDAIVSIQGDNADVVVSAKELTESERAQIEDIVIRKTGIPAESVVISTLNEKKE